MDELKKSKKQLIEELILLRERVSVLEKAWALEQDEYNKIRISQAEKQDLLLDSIDTHNCMKTLYPEKDFPNLYRKK